MNSLNSWAVVLLLSICFILKVRCDPAEGSRLLEEAFRDYDKRIRPNYGGSAVTVNVSVHILSISEVDTMAMTYTMTFFMRQIWTDTRLSFNSRRNIDMITLDSSTSERIWIPDTFFVHDISSVNHDILAKNQFCRISQDGLVLFSRRLTLKVFSPMSSDAFPYDSHKLTLELESYGFQMKDLEYQWAPEAITSGAKHAPGFRVYGIATKDASKTTSTGSYSRLSIEIDVKRSPLQYELGFMLSTFILTVFCLCSTSTRVTPTQGANAAFILVSMILALYVLLAMNGLKNMGIVTCMTVLQFYVLVSGGFGVFCLIVNIRRHHRSLRSSIQHTPERQSESTSENRTNDGLQVSVADASAEVDNNKECAVDKEEKVWGKVAQNFRKYRVDGCIGLPLWMSFLVMNFIFLLLCRLIR